MQKKSPLKVLQISFLPLRYPVNKCLPASLTHAQKLPLADSRENIIYNIERVLALYKCYWASMKKIFIYARPCVNIEFFHDDVLRVWGSWRGKMGTEISLIVDWENGIYSLGLGFSHWEWDEQL